MDKTKNQPLKGFRDFLPSEKRKRDFVISKVVEIFERFGFEPLETPTLEYADVLLGKYGTEADKLIYAFEDRGGRMVGLRYDQTVPIARVLARYGNEFPRGFRRYQIQNVFRAEKPQKGRFREFTQCDIDIFGTKSPLADAEIIACTYFSFINIGFKEVVLELNDRKTLFETLEKFATKEVDVYSIIQSIDKLDKVGKKEVISELTKKGLTKDSAEKSIKKINNNPLSDNLKEIIEYSRLLGVPDANLKYSPTMARGLDYYTGMIIETIIPAYPLGSFAGGGRYDKLVGQLGGPETPAVGIAFGLDRIVEAADKLGLTARAASKSVLVTIFSKELVVQSIKVVSQLREKGISVELFPDGDIKLDKQLKYADKKGFPFVAIIGSDEAKENKLILKELKTGKQEKFSTDEVASIINSIK